MESHPTLDLEGMSRVITLDYDYLPHHLKACMMYLSIFPEDYVIAKDRLLYRWIAEGLVAEKQGLITLFDVAEEYFNELISRNMIQQDKLEVKNTFFPAEMAEACRVHDMMLEAMVSKSRDANFVTLVGRQYGRGLPHGKVRRLSVHGNDDYDEDSSSSNKRKEVEQSHHARHGGIEVMNLQHVRSLSTFQSEGHDRKLLDRLGEFKLLRVLDLGYRYALDDKHMRDVCRLYLLRFLNLRGTPISVMPSKVGDLEYLETLDVQSTEIIDMPQTVTKLRRLEKLRAFQWVLPRGLMNMKVLREVDGAVLADVNVQVAREIGELQQLQVLYLEVYHSVVEEDEEAKEEFVHALGSSLRKTCALRSLHLYCPSSNEVTLDSYLRHVSTPPPLLRRLSMYGPISQFPDWISSLKHLAEFSVAGNYVDGDLLLDSLCNLPSLENILLGTRSWKEDLVVRPTHKFPALRILQLEFSKENEMSIGGIENLKKLKEVKLSGMENNPALERAVEHLMVVNDNQESGKIKVVVVKHW